MQNFFIAKHLYSRYRTCAFETDRCRQVRAQSPHYNTVPRIIHNNSSSIQKITTIQHAIEPKSTDARPRGLKLYHPYLYKINHLHVKENPLIMY